MTNVHAEEKVRYFSPESPEKKLLIVLAAHGNSDGTSIFCSVETMARELGCSERTVQRMLRKLESRGELKCLFVGKGRLASRYKIVVCEEADNLDPNVIAHRKRLLQGKLFVLDENGFVVSAKQSGDKNVTPPNKDLNNLNGLGDTPQNFPKDNVSGELFKENYSSVSSSGKVEVSQDTQNMIDRALASLAEGVARDAATPSRRDSRWIGEALYEIEAPAQS